MKINTLKLRWLFPILLGLLLVSCAPADQSKRTPPEAVNGVLDLRDWDLNTDGNIDLNGEWAFYWEQLLTPEQLSSAGTPTYQHITISMGVVSWKAADSLDVNKLLDKADSALYQAKEEGRNRVVSFDLED